MKVKDLIEKLREMPPDAEVFVTDQDCCGCGSVPLTEIDLVPQENKLYLEGDAR